MLIGLGLNKMNRVVELEDTAEVRGAIAKLPHWWPWSTDHCLDVQEQGLGGNAGAFFFVAGQGAGIHKVGDKARLLSYGRRFHSARGPAAYALS
jgi:hypothetical protein